MRLTSSHLEHPNPWFCPALLLEYRSQDRPDFWDYEKLNRTPIETLKIEPDDKSGRLNSQHLEKAWDRIGPINLPLPIWARAKPEILALPRLDSTAPSNYLRQNTPSLSSASLDDDPSPTTSVMTPKDSSSDSEGPSNDSEGPNTESKGTSNESNDTSNESKNTSNESKNTSNELEHDIEPDLSQHYPPTIQRAPSKPTKKRHITEAFDDLQPSARATRSHKVAPFYKLD